MPDKIKCLNCGHWLCFRPMCKPEWFCDWCECEADTDEIPAELLESWDRSIDDNS